MSCSALGQAQPVFYMAFMTVKTSSPAALSHRKLAGQRKGDTRLVACMCFSWFWYRELN